MKGYPAPPLPLFASPDTATLCAALAASTNGSATRNHKGGTSTRAVARASGRGPGMRRGSASVANPALMLLSWLSFACGAEARSPRSPKGLACTHTYIYQHIRQGKAPPQQPSLSASSTTQQCWQVHQRGNNQRCPATRTGAVWWSECSRTLNSTAFSTACAELKEEWAEAGPHRPDGCV